MRLESSREEPRPILVTGGNRTGTSWVGKMLILSGRLFTVWEPFNHLIPVPAFLPSHPLSRHYHRVQPADSRRMRRFIKGKMLLDIVRMQPRRSGVLGMTRKAFDSARTMLSYVAGRRQPVFKDPIALMSAEWMAHEFSARVLMLVRHPAAYVASVKRLGWRTPVEDFTVQEGLMDWLPSYLAEELLARQSERPEPSEGHFDLSDAALCWKVFHETVHIYRQQHTEWIMERHEDLSLEYLPRFRSLYRRMGLPWGNGQEDAIRKHCSSRNRLVRGDVVHEFRQDSAALTTAWMESLEAEEVDQVRRITSPVWQRFYSPDSWTGHFETKFE